MLKFLLQTVETKVRHDFVFEMEHAIDYHNWRGNNMITEYCSLEDIKEGCTFIDSDEIREYIPIGTVEFVSEYRCFVYNDRLVDIEYYSGEFDIFSDTNTIYEILEKYKYINGNALQAWTLDIAIDDYGNTIVMECHEFFSCGLYYLNFH